MRSKALKVAENIGYSELKASVGWLKNFLEGMIYIYKTIYGEFDAYNTKNDESTFIEY